MEELDKEENSGEDKEDLENKEQDREQLQDDNLSIMPTKCIFLQRGKQCQPHLPLVDMQHLHCHYSPSLSLQPVLGSNQSTERKEGGRQLVDHDHVSKLV